MIRHILVIGYRTVLRTMLIIAAAGVAAAASWHKNLKMRRGDTDDK